MSRATTTLLLILFINACARDDGAARPQAPSSLTSNPSMSADVPLPSYLDRVAKSGDLYARVDGGIVDAPAGDIAVLRSYPRFADKGPLSPTGERLTILTEKRVYAVGEEIRVIHVHEATKPGVELYAMGPKAIYGEYVDGALASSAAAAPPAAYDGAVLPSPGVDHNYEVSVHKLARGTHRLQWRFATLSGPTVLASNTLTIEVR
jgi:hypothetical protein